MRIEKLEMDNIWFNPCRENFFNKNSLLSGKTGNLNF